MCPRANACILNNSKRLPAISVQGLINISKVSITLTRCFIYLGRGGEGTPDILPLQEILQFNGIRSDN